MIDHEQQYPADTRLNYRPCVSCEREHHVSHLSDGWCVQCRGEQVEAIEDHLARKRELFRTTARVLREHGFADRAVWYEENMP